MLVFDDANWPSVSKLIEYVRMIPHKFRKKLFSERVLSIQVRPPSPKP